MMLKMCQSSCCCCCCPVTRRSSRWSLCWGYWLAADAGDVGSCCCCCSPAMRRSSRWSPCWGWSRWCCHCCCSPATRRSSRWSPCWGRPWPSRMPRRSCSRCQEVQAHRHQSINQLSAQMILVQLTWIRIETENHFFILISPVLWDHSCPVANRMKKMLKFRSVLRSCCYGFANFGGSGNCCLKKIQFKLVNRKVRCSFLFTNSSGLSHTFLTVPAQP